MVDVRTRSAAYLSWRAMASSDSSSSCQARELGGAMAEGPGRARRAVADGGSRLGAPPVEVASCWASGRLVVGRIRLRTERSLVVRPPASAISQLRLLGPLRRRRRACALDVAAGGPAFELRGCVVVAPQPRDEVEES